MQNPEMDQAGRQTGDEVLMIILQEFPRLKQEIAELYYVSSSFLEICEDYVLCLNSIRNFESGNKNSREKELIELKLVLSELKEEILSTIKI